MDHKLYLTDPGIYKNGSRFYYNKNNQEVVDQKILERIKKYAVPPAWKSVWYASNKNCHIQVYGTDSNGKKQYILSTKWINNQNSEKFIRIKTFIKLLPSFRKKIKLNNNINTVNNNTNNQQLPKDELIKLLLNLLLDTHIRVGNEIYAEKNNTYGLTTLRQKHVIKQPDDNYYFLFTGKSHIKHKIIIPPHYKQYIKMLMTGNKNKPLFYFSGNPENIITSEELNNFVRESLGYEYTCKDFRTYSANILFIKAFLKNSNKEINNIPANKIKQIILNSIDDSAKLLGHTRSICRKSYISNNLINYCVDNFKTASVKSSSLLLEKV